MEKYRLGQIPAAHHQLVNLARPSRVGGVTQNVIKPDLCSVGTGAFVNAGNAKTLCIRVCFLPCRDAGIMNGVGGNQVSNRAKGIDLDLLGR